MPITNLRTFINKRPELITIKDIEVIEEAVEQINPPLTLQQVRKITSATLLEFLAQSPELVYKLCTIIRLQDEQITNLINLPKLMKEEENQAAQEKGDVVR